MWRYFNPLYLVDEALNAVEQSPGGGGEFDKLGWYMVAHTIWFFYLFIALFQSWPKGFLYLFLPLLLYIGAMIAFFILARGKAWLRNSYILCLAEMQFILSIAIVIIHYRGGHPPTWHFIFPFTIGIALAVGFVLNCPILFSKKAVREVIWEDKKLRTPIPIFFPFVFYHLLAISLFYLLYTHYLHIFVYLFNHLSLIGVWDLGPGGYYMWFPKWVFASLAYILLATTGYAWVDAGLYHRVSKPMSEVMHEF